MCIDSMPAVDGFADGFADGFCGGLAATVYVMGTVKELLSALSTE